jgi:hypothetical protein
VHESEEHHGSIEASAERNMVDVEHVVVSTAYRPPRSLRAGWIAPHDLPGSREVACQQQPFICVGRATTSLARVRHESIPVETQGVTRARIPTKEHILDPVREPLYVAEPTTETRTVPNAFVK